MKSLQARITYKDQKTGETWTRGTEEFISHEEFGSYLWRNADRIARADVLTDKPEPVCGDCLYPLSAGCLCSSR